MSKLKTVFVLLMIVFVLSGCKKLTNPVIPHADISDMKYLTVMTYNDVCLTDFDVILARSDVVVSRVTTANFDARLPFVHLGFELIRGYVAVDATVSGVTYRVVNTHLEAFPEGIRIEQAKELVTILKTRPCR